MTADDLTFFIKLIRDRSGLVLTPDKAYLIESRLLGVARRWEIKSLDDLFLRLRSKPEPSLIQNAVDAMMTNESYFFRDLKPFEQFRAVTLPYLLTSRATNRSLRIWCAACSSGQEPYSLAMILAEEQFKLTGWDVEILATDLSTEILTKARAGIYTQFEVQRGLPVQYLIKYFMQQNERWVINSNIREMVRFRPLNLLEDLTDLGSFDVVFCRNVLIYFDVSRRVEVLSRIAQQMTPDGFLYLGGTENVVGMSERFQTVPNHSGIYHPVPISYENALAN